jgi:two-component system OmpR family response regulator
MGEAMNLLVIEDDPVMGKSLYKGLTEAGHDCVWVRDGKRGLEEAATRRAVDRPAAVMTAGDLTLDLTTRRVQRDGDKVNLTPTEFSILELLMRHAGQVVTRRMLCEHLWAADWEGTTNVIEVHINRLRQKLDSGESSLIQTVRGRGYALRAT